MVSSETSCPAASIMMMASSLPTTTMLSRLFFCSAVVGLATNWPSRNPTRAAENKRLLSLADVGTAATSMMTEAAWQQGSDGTPRDTASFGGAESLRMDQLGEQLHA